MESRSLLRPRFHAPTRRDTPLSQARSFVSMSGGEKPMAVCASCMPLASAVAVSARCVNSVNGRAALPRSRARPVCCYSRSWWGLPRSSGAIGAGGGIDVRASPCCVSNGWRCRWHPPALPGPPPLPAPLSRAQRAHYRLDWSERFARNARPPQASLVTIKLFGIPEDFASSLGLTTA